MPDEPNNPPTPAADPQPTDPPAPTREERRIKEFTQKLTTVEGERDTARTQLEASRRREVERIAGAHLAVPADLLTIGAAKLEELLDKDGLVDQEKVTKLAQQLVTDRPGLRRAGLPSPTHALPGGGTPRTATSGLPKSTLGDVLARRNMRE